MSFYNKTTGELFSIVDDCIVAPYVKFPNDDGQVTLFDFTYSSERMGTAPKISSTMYSFECYDLLWNVTDSDGNRIQSYSDIFTVFNGERYYLETTPTSSFSNEDARYKHELSFVSERIVLENIIMMNSTFKNYEEFTPIKNYVSGNYVLYENLVYRFTSDHAAGAWDYADVEQVPGESQITESTDFTFSGNIKEFSDRINASIASSGIMNMATITGFSEDNHFYGYHVVFDYYDEFSTTDKYVYGDIVTHTVSGVLSYYKFISGHAAGVWNPSEVEIYVLPTKLISISGSTIYDALGLIESEYGLSYYIDSEKTIHIRKYQTEISDTIEYGSEKSLISITRSNMENKIVTRMTAIGSSDNLPYYYPNPTEDGFLNGKASDASYPFIVKPDNIGSGLSVTNPSSPSDKFYKLGIDDKFAYGTLVRKYTSMTPEPYLTSSLSEDGLTLTVFLHVNGELWLFVTSDIGETYLVPLKINTLDCNLVRISDGENLMKDESGNLTTFGTNFNSGKPVSLPAGIYAFSYKVNLSSRPILFSADYYGYYIVWDKITYLYDFNEKKSWSLTQSKNPIVVSGFFEHKNDENIFLDLVPTYTENSLGNRILDSAYGWFRINPTGENRISDFDSTKTYEIGALVFAIADGMEYNMVYRFKTAHTGAWSWDDVTSAVFWDNKALNNKYPEVGRLKYESGKTYQDKDEDSAYYGKRYVCTETETYPQTGMPFFRNIYDKIPYKSSSQILEEYDFSGCSLYKLAWSLNGKEESPLDYGMTLRGTPNLLQEIVMNRFKYIIPQSSLMPEIYFKTNGDRRFYPAKNYPFTKTDNYELDEDAGEEISNSNVINENYQNDGGESIIFENQYKKSSPKEHIETFDDIKPTIKECLNGDGDRIDVVLEFQYDKTDSDELEESDSDSTDSLNYKHPYFFAKLRKLGFNIFDLAIDEEDMILNITSGPCGSGAFKIMVGSTHEQNTVRVWKYDVYELKENLYTKIYKKHDPMRYYDGTLYYNTSTTSVPFYTELDGTQYKNLPEDKEWGDVICTDVTLGSVEDCQKDTTDNEVWIALLKDVSTFGTIIPSKIHSIEPVSYTDSQTDFDTFVLTHILMPQAYIRTAEKKLTKELIKYMGENNTELFSYAINFSRIFFAQHVSIQELINENSLLNIKYAGHETKKVYVSSFTYKMAESDALPEISVELKDTIAENKYRYVQRAGTIVTGGDTGQSSISKTGTLSIKKIGRTFITRNGTNQINGNLRVTGNVTGSINAILDDGRIITINEMERNVQNVSTNVAIERVRKRSLSCILKWNRYLSVSKTAPWFEYTAGVYKDTLNSMSISISAGHTTTDLFGYALVDETVYNIFVTEAGTIYLLDSSYQSNDFLVGILSAIDSTAGSTTTTIGKLRHVSNYYGTNTVDGRAVVGQIADDGGDVLVDMGTGELSFKKGTGTKKVSEIDTTVTNLDGSVATLEENITTINGNIDTINGNISTLDDKVAATDSTVSSLSDDVSALDTKVTILDGSTSMLSYKKLYEAVHELQYFFNSHYVPICSSSASGSCTQTVFEPSPDTDMGAIKTL